MEIVIVRQERIKKRKSASKVQIYLCMSEIYCNFAASFEKTAVTDSVKNGRQLPKTLNRVT